MKFYLVLALIDYTVTM